MTGQIGVADRPGNEWSWSGVEEHSGAESAPAPAVVTGEPRVDETLRRLDELGELPVSDHPGVFERVHSQLVEVLGELRSGTDADAVRGGGPQH
jgi:hypothetical protein